ncbi:DUF2062 domain-containing protein [Mucilaginibacter gotjawali]|uniref:Uncharacterized protein n=2 Tax=Mucilaginibacter gotjawali TaxID=1550579 RepID=A0A110B0E3_9SPHI|nr:DUF2062 domain-containing protein [Mucilaginibacter gotjawali]MBB3057849.1 uncharacterized protein (DUF2062 family) [Mucilaginibacter gotjawali]BAU52379.1 hypothetical protein MgSA37_00535 [Mucilaginibacter gotjawali]
MRIPKALKVNIIKSIKVAAALCSKKGLKKLAAQLYDPNQSDERKAFSAALGIFLGIIPIWGFQTLSAIFLSVFFKLNKALVLIFSHISLPPLLPFVIFLSYKTGSLWMPASVHGTGSAQNLKAHLQQYIYGGISLAAVVSLATGLLTFATLKLIKFVKKYRLEAGTKATLTLA